MELTELPHHAEAQGVEDRPPIVPLPERKKAKCSLTVIPRPEGLVFFSVLDVLCWINKVIPIAVGPAKSPAELLAAVLSSLEALHNDGQKPNGSRVECPRQGQQAELVK